MNVDIRTEENALIPVGTEVDVSVTAVAGALVTAAQVPDDAKCACITMGDKGVMLTFDGVTPADATVGCYKAAGSVLWVSRAAILAGQVVSVTDDSVVHVSFWTT